jgi:hypothetical protein
MEQQMSQARALLVLARVTLAGVLLALVAQPAVRHAEAAAVSLQYRFVAGQTLTYTFLVSTTSRVVVTNTPADIEVTRVEGQTHYIIHDVQANGDANIAIRNDHFSQVDSLNGTTTRFAPDPALVTSSYAHCLQSTDGTQSCGSQGAFGLGDMGTLPHTAVSVGDTWTSELQYANAVAGGAPLVMHNTLVQLAPGNGGTIATVHSVGELQGQGQTDYKGQRYAVTLRITIDGRWRFSVSSGQYLSQTLHETRNYTGTAKGSSGTQALFAYADQVSTMQFVPAGH